MPAFIDLKGQKFGNWIVLKRGPNDLQKKPQWICKCQCGDIHNIRGKTLREGSSKGCRKCQMKRSMFRHGLSRSPTYKIWAYMIARCHNPKDTAYKWYGARGIKVCKRWRDGFLNFLSDMGERPPNLTIDRIDNYKGYSKKNCRWATLKEQAQNTRRYIKNGTIRGNWKLLYRHTVNNRVVIQCIKCEKIVEKSLENFRGCRSAKCSCIKI